MQTTINTIKHYLQTHTKWVVTIGSFLLIIVILFSISVFSGEKDPSQLIADFRSAILTEDLESLEDIIQVENDDVDVTEEDLKQLVAYSKKNSGFFKELIDILYAQQAFHTQQMNAYSKLIENKSKEEVEQMSDFYLKKDEGLFNDSYEIVVRPKFIEFQADTADTTIKINDQKAHLKKGQKQKLGPFFPNIYQVTGEAKFPYANATIQNSWEVDLLGRDQGEEIVESNVNITGDSAVITAKHPNVRLYSNGKKTPFITTGNLLVDEVGDYETLIDDPSAEYYPITKQKQKIHGEIQLPWGRAKSNEVTISSDQLNGDKPLQVPLSFNLYLNKQNESQIVQQIEQLAKAIESTYNGHPANWLKDITYNRKESYDENYTSPLLSHLQEMLSDRSIKGTTLKSLTISRQPQLDQHNRLVVPISIKHKEQYEYWDSDKTDNYNVTLKYENKKWKIAQVFGTVLSPMDSDNVIVKEF